MSDRTKHVGPFLKYSLLPGLLPRIYELFASGFSYFAFFMASIYNIFQLIPNHHPYLYSANIGRFGVRHVVAEASRNLVFKRENSDKIILYFVMMAALVILFVQFGALLLAIVSPSAIAAGLGTYFGVNNPAVGPLTAATAESQDIAFILLDRVFGVPGIFDSCVTTATPCYGMQANFDFDTTNVVSAPLAPWPFHLALHSMFQFYSTALLIIGVIIIIYHIISITAETAQTGTPFGKRFNTVWAPIRLVVAIGLLVPVSSGLNSAQYIVLYAAKMGSNMATNGWLTFNGALGASIAGGGLVDADEMIGTPNAPTAKDLVTFMILAKACAIIEDAAMQQGGGTVLNGTNTTLAANQRNSITPFLVRAMGAPKYLQYVDSHASGVASAPMVTYANARTFYQNGDISIVFGELNPSSYSQYKGGVKPYCGELVLKNTALYEPGAETVQTGYYNLIAEMWFDEAVEDVALDIARDIYPNIPLFIPSGAPLKVSDWPNPPVYVPLNSATPQTVIQLADDFTGDPATPGTIKGIIADGVADQQTSTDMDLPDQMLARGWAGAGIWYNRIAQMNGAMTGASRNLPSKKAFPLTMVHTMQQHVQLDEKVVSVLDQLDPEVKNTLLNYKRAGEEKAQKVYQEVYKLAMGSQASLDEKSTGNPIIDGINLLFGTEGLFNLRSPENRDIHPLAQLSGIGKALIESAIMNLGIGAAAGGACALGGSDMGCTGMGAAFGIAGLGLTIGFILFYVIPFLPFVYFFFAIGNWIKTIFEAMVGAPLWALGHLRIDGDGLPGDGALNGYYLIFELFLRPILIVFGLLASVLIFSAMAAVLNNIWDLVTVNAAGFNANDPTASGGGTIAEAISWSRGKVDQLFFLVIYAVILYMMALSSFKLIDMIPNSILRWMGSSVTSFGDSAQDAAQSLTQYAAIGGGMVFQQGLGGVQGGIQGMKQSGDAAAQLKASQEAAKAGGG